MSEEYFAITDIEGMEVSVLFYALLFFMVLDYITGLIVAIKNHKLNSNVGFKGILKKVTILAVVSMGFVIDLAIVQNHQAVTIMVILFYISNECLSVLENANKINVPLPQKLVELLDALGNQK